MMNIFCVNLLITFLISHFVFANEFKESVRGELSTSLLECEMTQNGGYSCSRVNKDIDKDPLQIPFSLSLKATGYGNHVDSSAHRIRLPVGVNLVTHVFVNHIKRETEKDYYIVSLSMEVFDDQGKSLFQPGGPNSSTSVYSLESLKSGSISTPVISVEGRSFMIVLNLENLLSQKD